MEKLSKFEKETYIYYNKAESIATINSYDSAINKRFRIYASQYPEYAKVIEEDDNGFLHGTITKDRLSIIFKAPKHFTDEQKIEMLNKLKKLG